ncbi:heterokaryon incompatibility protein-domain-containing protein [Clohesyomyces aquaticus]|uniref:Heterokaryon incompatibility protein-domain-containing protein n=1 Tax=Clohesyomyces aquaticus TaxID=1231657 RepID=A0A1Y2A8I2_9PLEO|nr:heterokaryon incompatibility protein-domain-containing protein [Clohesyomyces aquaticus]
MPSAPLDLEYDDDDVVSPLDWEWAVDGNGNIELHFHQGSPQKRLVPGTYRSSYRPTAKNPQAYIRPPVFRHSTLQTAYNAYPPSPPKTPPKSPPKTPKNRVQPLSRRNTAPVRRSRVLHLSHHRPEPKAIEIGDPSTVLSSRNVIKSWLHECDENHDCNEHGLKRATSHGPLWLVDVDDDCIVSGSKSAGRYVTLSYVCGKVRSLQLMSHNLRILQRPGVLREQNSVFVIPRTLRQAMNFTKSIGERYLWVDELCILQDDEKVSKQAQISNMASIFASSVVTFAAAGGNSAEWGLHETGDITSRADRRSRLPRHDTDHRVQDIHYDLLRRSEWIKRGWTFQELVFSKRVVFFFNDRITWECSHAVSDDTCPAQSIIRHPYQESFFPKTQGFNDFPWPDLEEYHRLVAGYNERKLTHASDAVPAFTGITSALSTSFTGGFLFGIPAQFLDVALLWQPLSILKRRKMHSTCKKQAALPSWSWLGWQGELDLNLWASGYDYMHKKAASTRGNGPLRKTSIQIKSIVQWYLLDGQSKTTRIFNSAHRYRYLKNDQNADLPDEWRRNKESLSTDENYRCTYSHPSYPNATFNYPIPTTTTPLEDVSTIQTSLLTCRATRAFFRIGERCWAPHKCLSVDIIDKHGAWAGSLRLNHRRFDIVPELRSNARWELIAISEGVAENARSEAALLEEWNHPKRPRDGRLYEFYNVMWIEWKGKIAYRKALGRVLKSAWNTAAKERIDVILG